MPIMRGHHGYTMGCRAEFDLGHHGKGGVMPAHLLVAVPSTIVNPAQKRG